MSKESKPNKPQGNPYKILYWMGAGVALLLLGIVALAVFYKPQPRVSPDPERILIWLYEDGNKGGPAVLAVVEESRSQKSLVVVPFLAPTQATEAFASRGARAGTDEVSNLLQRKLHHRVFLPSSLVAKVIDAAGGILVQGQRYHGEGAMAYIAGGGDQAAGRTVAVILAMTDSIASNGIDIGVTEGLRMARQVDTSMDLTAMPRVLERWKAYPPVQVETPPPTDHDAVRKLLQVDPSSPDPK